MIESVRIKRFRGFKDIEINDIKRITIISGNNNIGKSSVLEAMFFVYDRINGSPFLKMNRMRGDSRNITIGNTWESAFYGMNTDEPIEITLFKDGVESILRYEKEVVPVVKIQNGINNMVGIPGNISNISPYALKMVFERGAYREEGDLVFVSGNEQTQFLNPVHCTQDGEDVLPLYFENMFMLLGSREDDGLMVDLLSKVELSDAKNELLDVLHIIDDEITDISVISREGFVQLYVKKSGISIPFKYCGDGIVKVANMVLHLMADEGSVLLADEIDNGLHYSIQKELWSSLAQVAQKHNCQIIATTHSYECISAAYHGIRDREMADDFSFIRLENVGGEIKPQVYCFDDLGDAIEADVEVR